MAKSARSPSHHDVDACRVLVTDYPKYTSLQELKRLFLHIGEVHVHKKGVHHTVLEFTKPEDANRATTEAHKINIYGFFLTVTPFDPMRVIVVSSWGPWMAHLKEMKWKHKNYIKPIIQPNEIDLTSGFHQQMDNIMANVCLTQDEVDKIGSLYSDIQNVLQRHWPGCEAIPFGSIHTGLGIKTSDADCFISLPSKIRHAKSVKLHVRTVGKVLRSNPNMFENIVNVPRANTPIVKLRHVRSGVACDVSFNKLGVRNSALVAALLRRDKRLLHLAIVLKYWAQVHELSGSGHLLTNYALVMMLVFYLQCRGVLPSVQQLQVNLADEVLVDHWNTGFRFEPAPSLATDDTRLADLLGGFFEFYAAFDFDALVVCPLLGRAVPRSALRNGAQLPNGFERLAAHLQRGGSPLRIDAPLCVQDPFNLAFNVAGGVNVGIAAKLRAHLAHGAEAYAAKYYRPLLPMLLLPKLQLENTLPWPRKGYASIFSLPLEQNALRAIADSNWEEVLSRVILVIFEHMLRIELCQVEVASATATEQRCYAKRQCYLGVLTKPVWRGRDSDDNLKPKDSVMHPDLQEWQARITDKITKTSHERLECHFRMTLCLGFSRNAAVVLNLANGDRESFRQFGKFMRKVLNLWFVPLIKQ